MSEEDSDSDLQVAESSSEPEVSSEEEVKHNRRSTTQRKAPTGRSRKIELSDEDDSQIVTIRKSQTETQLFEREDDGEEDGPETGN